MSILQVATGFHGEYLEWNVGRNNGMYIPITHIVECKENYLDRNRPNPYENIIKKTISLNSKQIEGKHKILKWTPSFFT